MSEDAIMDATPEGAEEVIPENIPGLPERYAKQVETLRRSFQGYKDDAVEEAFNAVVGMVENARASDRQPARPVVDTGRTVEPERVPTRPARGVTTRFGWEHQIRSWARKQAAGADARLADEICDVMSPEAIYDTQRFLVAFAQRDQTTLQEFKARAMAEARAMAAQLAGQRAPVEITLPVGAGHIPQPIVNTINLLRQAGSTWRPFLTNVTMTAETLKYPTSGLATAEMVDERGANSNAAGPTPGSKLLTARKMRWKGQATMEFLQDSAFNTATWFAAAVAEAFGALEDTQVSASSELAPNFTQNIHLTVTQVPLQDGGTPGALTYVDIVNLVNSVPKPYRRRGIFAGDNQMMTWLATIVDLNGRPIFESAASRPMTAGDASLGGDGTVLGRPAIEVPILGGVLWFGDPSQYALGTRLGMQMMSSDSVLWDTDEIAFKAIGREDGVILQDEAMRKFIGITQV